LRGQLGKSRFASQGIESRHAKFRDPHDVLIDSLSQAIQRSIDLVEADVHNAQIQRRNITHFGASAQPGKYLHTRPAIAGATANVTQHRQVHCSPVGFLRRGRKRGLREPVFPARRMDVTQEPVHDRSWRPQIHGLTYLTQRVVIHPRPIVSEPYKPGDRRRQRIEVPRLLHLGDGFVMPFQDGKQIRVPLVRHSVIRIQPESLLVPLFRLFPIPVVAFAHFRKRGMRRRQRSIDLQRLCGGGPGPRIHLLGGTQTVNAHHQPGVCQTDVRQGVCGVDVDGLLEERDGVQICLRSLLVPETAALQVILEGGARHLPGPGRRT